MYKSPGFQNDIIHICDILVKSKIVPKVNTAELAVLADETIDIGKFEQMPVCVRYCGKKE